MYTRAAFSAFLSLTILTACSERPEQSGETPAASEPAEKASDAEVTASDEGGISDEACGSLKRLLKLLPAAHTVESFPETYRTCDTAAYEVSVGYNNEGEQFTSYKYSVKVLTGDSPFAASIINPQNASAEQKAYFSKALTAIGDMYKGRVDLCKNYVANQIIPDGRNPVLVKVKDVDVCVMDNLDANKEVWNAFAVHRNLGFQLEISGVKAGEMKTAEQAKANLAPLFALFALDASVE